MDEELGHLTNDEIQRLIKKSLSGKRDWRVLARIILEYEREKLWKGEASSFSAWLKQFAGQLGVHISNLWRFRRAAKAAFMLWGEHGQRRINSLMDIPEGISPESIEILEKISRAAPSYTVNELSTRLFEKTITMNALRVLWRKFRPALKGDARGRNKLAPRLSRGDARRRDELFQNLVIESLGSLNLKGLGYEKNTSKKLVADVKMSSDQGEVDVVMLVRLEGGEVDIHGIEVEKDIDSVRPESLEKLKRYCDYVWVALDEEPTQELFNLNTGIGLLHVRESKLDVIKKAEKTEADLGEIMARRLINKIIK